MSLYNDIAAQMVLNAQNGRGSAALSSIGPDNSGASVGSSGIAKGVSRRSFMNTALPCFGGIKPVEALSLVQKLQRETYAKKNLWLLDVTSAMGINIPERFNLFATDVEYTPCMLQGESIQVGGAQIASVVGSEAAELRITTYDDAAGTLKKWFSAHHALVSPQDGTVSEPAKYAIRIAVLHSYVERSAAGRSFESVGLFRPTSMDISLSRREDNLEEISMTFTQLDTFMKAKQYGA